MSKRYDVFISHASEDKDSLVRELADHLSGRGYKVWYDEFELSVGKGLRRSIDYGIRESRYGIVVLSKHFFGKGWPNYELDGLVQIDIEHPGIILPIWHDIGQRDVSAYSASLANIVAILTNNRTVSDVVTQLERTIGEYRYFVDPNQSVSRSLGKTVISAGQRAAGFQVLMSTQSDQMINRTESNCRSDITIYPYSSDYCEHPFHYWQNEPGSIRLIRHVVYELGTESIISSKNEIVQNDGCHLVSIVHFLRNSPGPIRIVSDVTSTNQFKGLFDDGFEFVEFNNKSQVEHFSYAFTMPNSSPFLQIRAYANEIPLAFSAVPGTLTVNHVVRPIIAGTKLKYSFVNEAIASKA